MALGGREVALLIKILADASQAQSELKGTQGALGKTQNALSGMVGPATVALGAVTVFAGGAAAAASSAEQNMGAVDAVFKDNAKVVHRWSKTSSDDLGVSSSEYEQMAALIGSQLKNMGTDMTNLAPQTDALISLGADLAAQYGGSTADAVAALSSLLKGERDPIEKYGVSIKQAGIDSLVGAENLKTMTQEQKTAAQSNAALTLLMQQTADAQGAYNRESGTAAQVTQEANAGFQDMLAVLGESLLPIVIFLGKTFQTLTKLMSENKRVVLIVGAVVGALSVAIIALNVAMKIARGVTLAMQAAQWLLNAAMAANPIGLVVLVILALVAAFVVAYKKSETFRRIVDGVFAAVMAVVKTAVDFIVGLFAKLGAVLAGPFQAFQRVVATVVGIVKGAIQGLWNFIKPIFDLIGKGIKVIKDGIAAVKSAIDRLPKIPKMPWDTSKGAPAAMAPVPTRATALGRSTTAGGGGASGGITINIHGALDPEGTARAVQRVLASHRVRVGRSGPLSTQGTI